MRQSGQFQTFHFFSHEKTPHATKAHKVQRRNQAEAQKRKQANK